MVRSVLGPWFLPALSHYNLHSAAAINTDDTAGERGGRDKVRPREDDMDDDNARWTRILRVSSRILFLSFPEGSNSFCDCRQRFPSFFRRRSGGLFLSFFAFADSRNSVVAEKEEATHGAVRVRYS